MTARELRKRLAKVNAPDDAELVVVAPDGTMLKVVFADSPSFNVGVAPRVYLHAEIIRAAA
jgi:fructose-specific component phosphotransferase system IIB-like protein